VALAIVILAAGLGTRMKSATPKVLHMLNGKPVVRHVTDTAKALKPGRIIVVVGPQGSALQNALKGSGADVAVQKYPRGTADALSAALQMLQDFRGTVMVLGGDTPLVALPTLRRLLTAHRRRKEAISILSFIAGSDHSYGRIVRVKGNVTAIIEDRDADKAQKNITEVNSGIYAIDSTALALLKDIKINPQKKEFYLTDLIGMAASRALRVGSHILGDETELTGINTRRELLMAGLFLRDRTVSKWLDRGVSFIDAKTVFIDPDAKIGMDTIIYPNVIIEGRTEIGTGCIIYPNSRISNSRIGKMVTIKDSTIIESSIVREGATLGPFAHLRPGSEIGSSAKIGNFVEIKKSTVGRNSKASHLSYIGDAKIGDNVNIGAGTITCNYDGMNKFRTIIEDGSFIGSDTQLVAPVKVGKGAYVGSGTTVTIDVPPMALALSRTPQLNIEGWALRRAVKIRKNKNTK
jgi:bifunctional UDP-N-acetylglucosamine pyrophosphorylase / glucosamine-1-phosphate N-acetyltransferase